ncbi:outer membrane beta-barrel protein [Parafilimonas sp.]|uniref:outer membrane beta-barrel protein n=1 Tax=Parafilimonas sp. TaxID=1969739 RepID=UPI0039E2F8C3
MKSLLLSFQFILISSFLLAQHTGIAITGIIMDSATQKPLPGTTVTISFKGQDGMVSRSKVSNLDGRFTVESIAAKNEIMLQASSIGYAAVSKKINLAGYAKKGNAIDIGTLHLTVQANALQTVVVTAQAAPAMKFGIDSKVFNVEKNIAAQGGSGVDVMKNIPSVSVDAEGNVQLRNSTPQIFIDGRPTILTLDQIAADDIERVELITNPSAKYDASSSGGIINIILKKNKTIGLNGIVSVGGGTPGVLNDDLNLNYRAKKFNLFASGNYNRGKGTAIERTYRENKDDGIITDYFNQSTNNNRLREFYSVRFGADYFIDDKSTLSFMQGFNNGKFATDQTQNQEYYDDEKILDYTGVRLSTSNGNFKRGSSRLSFERKFNSPDNKLTADVTYNTGSRNNSDYIVNNFYNPDGSDYQPATRVRNSGLTDEYQVNGQIDYSNKISDNKRIEFGLRTFYNHNKSNFATYSIDEAENETKLPLSNNIKYTEKVNAGYFNYANGWKSFVYQVGLRAELSELDGSMIDSNLSFGYKFPNGFKDLKYVLFPSFFITKHISESEDIQFNYSKRIRRPRFWEVNPFIDMDDPLNISQGNPALNPEYTNSFELNYYKRFAENSGSFLGVIYFKNNVGDITEYSDTISQSLFEQLNNAAVSSNAVLSTFINAGYENRWGTELTLQKNITKQLDLTLNTNMQYAVTKASVGNLDLNNSGFNYNAKFIGNYKMATEDVNLFNNLGFQLIADYNGPRVIPQGRNKAQFSTDIAVRKEFFRKKAGALSFSVNDLFNSRKFGTIYDTEAFYQDGYRRWDVRTMRLTFSYRFGDADLFRKKDNHSNESDFDQPGTDS